MLHPSLRPHVILGSLLSLLMIVTSAFGLLSHESYRPFFKTEVLLVGLPAQDTISLLAGVLLIPVMVWSLRGSVRAFLVWTGILLYAAYFYAFYCFDYVYTPVYPLYLVIMGVATYSLIGLLAGADSAALAATIRPQMPVRLLAIILAIPVLFVPIWLSRIFAHIATQQRGEADLVFVLDLAFLIPGLLLAAVQLWRRRPLGYLLSGMLLAKCLITGVLLTSGSLLQMLAGIHVAAEEMALYVFLAVAGSSGLALYLRNVRETAQSHPANKPRTAYAR